MASLEDYDGPTPTSEWMDPSAITSALDAADRGEGFHLQRKRVRPVTGGAGGAIGIEASEYKHIRTDFPNTNWAQFAASAASPIYGIPNQVRRGLCKFSEQQDASQWSYVALRSGVAIADPQQDDSGYGSPPAIGYLDAYAIIDEFDASQVTWNNQGSLALSAAVNVLQFTTYGAGGEEARTGRITQIAALPIVSTFWGFFFRWRDETPPWPATGTRYFTVDSSEVYLLP